MKDTGTKNTALEMRVCRDTTKDSVQTLTTAKKEKQIESKSQKGKAEKKRGKKNGAERGVRVLETRKEQINLCSERRRKMITKSRGRQRKKERGKTLERRGLGGKQKKWMAVSRRMMP